MEGRSAFAAPRRRPPIVTFVLAAAIGVAAILGLFIATAPDNGLLNLFGPMSEGAARSAYLVSLFVILMVLIWTGSVFVRRSNKLRTIGSSIERVLEHLVEPENAAAESVATLGQAVRREMSAVGNAVERAIARGSELEVTVQAEVSALERSYDDNERRMRALLKDLSGQREAILTNTDGLRTSIVRAQESLALDISRASEAIAESVGRSGGRITQALSHRINQQAPKPLVVPAKRSLINSVLTVKIYLIGSRPKSMASPNLSPLRAMKFSMPFCNGAPN